MDPGKNGPFRVAVLILAWNTAHVFQEAGLDSAEGRLAHEAAVGALLGGPGHSSVRMG